MPAARAAGTTSGEGKTVTLVPEKGLPRWHRLALGQEGSKAYSERDQQFSVHTDGLALVELLPEEGDVYDLLRFLALVKPVVVAMDEEFRAEDSGLRVVFSVRGF